MLSYTGTLINSVALVGEENLCKPLCAMKIREPLKLQGISLHMINVESEDWLFIASVI